jgi:hypothetical protein
LPSNYKRDTQTDTQTKGGFMKYVVQMGSDAMIYISSIIKMGLGIQNLIGRIHKHTDTESKVIS